ncbi:MULTISPECIES: hypothetical protein [unclassified Streptomyces]|uniref:hypothetical protein n=1 Tax=unclassified Streptomyces TaxID=2593676 RepID=UPI002E2A0B7F|nr:hypothetical protein [Streptomyces sp. NBC_00228]
MDDLDADFLAIYGINEPLETLSGPRYFKLAYRVGAYNGVMTARIAKEQEDQRDEGGHAGSQFGGSEQELQALNLATKKPGEVAQLIDYTRAPEGG